MSPRTNIILIVAVAAAFLIRMSVFTVDEREHVIKFRFSAIVQSEFEPGLHFKIPFVNNTVAYEDRIQKMLNSQERFLTSEKKNLIVDYYVTWRIREPAQFYRATGGNVSEATVRLSAIVKEGLKAAFSARTVQEVVSAERAELMDQTLQQARGSSPELGIEVVDVRVNRIELAAEVSDSVFDRMREERNRVAVELRAEGNEQSERIRSDADRQRTVIQAEAYRAAERIRGEGDAEAAALYANAYNRDRDFAAFYLSMNAYERAIREDDLLVLDSGSEFYRFLQSEGGTAQEQAGPQ